MIDDVFLAIMDMVMKMNVDSGIEVVMCGSNKREDDDGYGEREGR